MGHEQVDADALARDLVAALPHLFWTATPDGEVEVLSPAWAALAPGVGEAAALAPAVVHPDDLPGVLDRWAECVRTGGPFRATVRVRVPSPAPGADPWRWHDSVAVLTTASDGSARWFGSAVDVTDLKVAEAEQRRLAREVAHQASHDALTGLVNRRELERRLGAVLAGLAEPGARSALLYVDLDQFKVVNDTDGHVAGDALLRELAGVLRSCVRSGDTVARLGGDEFAVVLRDCPLPQARRVALSLTQAVGQHRFVWEGRTHRVGASVGLVALTAGVGDLATVLRAADGACYAAKDAGGGRVHVYQPGDASLARRQGETEWVGRLRDAFERGALVLHAQRIEQARGPFRDGPRLEVLVRLQDTDGALVPPGQFMPAAERYQLAGTLDRAVVELVLRWFADRPGLLDRLSSCSVNLSGATLGDPEAHGDLERLVARSGLPADRLCFEVTETAAIANLDDAVEFMDLMRRHGCRFALDDFGSGLSSFAYLRDLPVDLLKIDGAFVREVEADRVDVALVRAINEVAHLLGKRTVAEYVETERVRAVVSALGVDYLQGYAVGRPAPLADVVGAGLGTTVT